MILEHLGALLAEVKYKLHVISSSRIILTRPIIVLCFYAVLF